MEFRILLGLAVMCCFLVVINTIVSLDGGRTNFERSVNTFEAKHMAYIYRVADPSAENRSILFKCTFDIWIVGELQTEGTDFMNFGSLKAVPICFILSAGHYRNRSLIAKNVFIFPKSAKDATTGNTILKVASLKAQHPFCRSNEPDGLEGR